MTWSSSCSTSSGMSSPSTSVLGGGGRLTRISSPALSLVDGFGTLPLIVTPSALIIRLKELRERIDIFSDSRASSLLPPSFCLTSIRTVTMLSSPDSCTASRIARSSKSLSSPPTRTVTLVSSSASPSPTPGDAPLLATLAIVAIVLACGIPSTQPGLSPLPRGILMEMSATASPSRLTQGRELESTASAKSLLLPLHACGARPVRLGVVA